MRKITDKALGILVLLMAAAAMSAVVFLLRRPETAAAWMGYWFFLLAEVVCALLLAGLGRDNLDAAHSTHTLPMQKLAFLYVGAAALLTAAFTIIAPQASWKVALCTELVVHLAFWGMGIVTGIAVRKVLENQRENKARRQDIRALAAQMRNAADTTQNPALKEMFSALAEDLRFAPLGNTETAPQDNALWGRTSEVLELAQRGDEELAKKAAETLRFELARRNRGRTL